MGCRWDWTCHTHPTSSTGTAFAPGTPRLFPPALRPVPAALRIYSLFHPSLGDCPRSAATFPAKPGSNLGGEVGRRWHCRAGGDFAEQAMALPSHRYCHVFFGSEGFTWRQAVPPPPLPPSADGLSASSTLLG